MVSTLIGPDKHGDAKVLITGSGDPLDPDNQDMLFSSDYGAVSVIQSGFWEITGASRQWHYIDFPEQSYPPMCLCALSRPGSGIYRSINGVASNTPEKWQYQGDWLLGPSLTYAFANFGNWQFTMFYRVSVTKTRLGVDVRVAKQGNSSHNYFLKYYLLGVG